MYVFTVQQLVPAPVKAFRKLASSNTELSEFTIPSKNGDLTIRQYVPTGKPHAPVLLLVHGLAQGGRLDDGLNVLARNLAANGFHVLIPEIVTERDGLMRATALTDIGSAIHYGRTLKGSPVSAMGVSFGGGLLLRTVAMPEYAEDVKSVLCISAYNDLVRVGHFYIGDPVEGPKGERYTESPMRSGPLLMAYQYLEDFVGAGELPKFRQAAPQFVFSIDTGNRTQQAKLLSTLPSEAAKRMMELVNPSTPALHQEFEAMLERHAAQNAYLSPHNKLKALKAPVYILHGRTDPAIPVGEAEWNCMEIEGAGGDCYLHITPWLHHAMLDKQAAFAEKVRVSYFVSRFFNAAAH